MIPHIDSICRTVCFAICRAVNFATKNIGFRATALATARATVVATAFFLSLFSLLILFSSVILFAQPAVRSFSPTNTTPGTNIVITGVRFTGTTAVSIGGTAASSFTVDNDGQITAVIACNNASGDVAVTTSAGTGRLTGFTLSAANLFLSGFTPTSGPPGTIVTLTGRGLQCVTRVTIGGVSATEVVTSIGNQTSMNFTIPNGAATGVIILTSTFSAVSSNERFTVTVPAPAITGFSPTSGTPGTVVTVTGTNLTGTTQVSVGGIAASYTVNRDGTVSVTIPANAQTGIISITTAGGTATSGRTTFTVLPSPPTITNFTPTRGNPGTTILIQGTNLTGATEVLVGNTRAASFVVVSPTTITFVIPSGAATGAITVVTPGGRVTASSVLTVSPTSVRVAEEHAMRLFPQPAHDATTLEYLLSQPSSVSVEIVNSLGNSVAKYPTQQQTSGVQRMALETQGLSQGAYFVRVNIGGKAATVPLQVVR